MTWLVYRERETVKKPLNILKYLKEMKGKD